MKSKVGTTGAGESDLSPAACLAADGSASVDRLCPPTLLPNLRR